MGRQINVKYTQNYFRERWVTYNDKPKYRSLRGFTKTKICHSWKESGYCIYGENCNFAHGLRELRMLPEQHKKLKNVTYKIFLAGCCLSGSRCRFSHAVFD